MINYSKQPGIKATVMSVALAENYIAENYITVSRTTFYITVRFVWAKPSVSHHYDQQIK